jgi:4-hydroxy-3-methylbut-2-enyl diphosphate reductase
MVREPVSLSPWEWKMTETQDATEPQAADLKTALAGWVETPPESLSAALAERGVDAAALEEYARSGIGTEEAEALRRVLVQAAAAGGADEAALLARMTPLLDPRERAWDRVLKAKANNEIVSATVTEATKGGVVVDLGVRGFIPSSQIGLSVPKNLAQYVGRSLRLRVVEVDRRRGTVILSNRSVMEEERASRRRAAIAKLEEGQERSGTVRRITDIGAFVDVGGVDGLLHVSEIAWRRIEHPSEVLEVGQKVQVQIIRLDPQTERISLSMRRLSQDPWEVSREKFHIGDVVKAKITKLVPQGAVVQLDDDTEGFIPVSELAQKRVNSPEEVVAVDQEIEPIIIEMHPRDRRIVLSLRKKEQKKERQALEQHQKQARASERTTLGDLFGHLFAEFQHEVDEAIHGPSNGKTQQDGAAAPEEAPAAAEVSEEPAVAEAPSEPPVAEAAPEPAVAETPDQEAVSEDEEAVPQPDAPIVEALSEEPEATEKEAEEKEREPALV